MSVRATMSEKLNWKTFQRVLTTPSSMTERSRTVSDARVPQKAEPTILFNMQAVFMAREVPIGINTSATFSNTFMLLIADCTNICGTNVLP